MYSCPPFERRATIEVIMWPSVSRYRDTKGVRKFQGFVSTSTSHYITQLNKNYRVSGIGMAYLLLYGPVEYPPGIGQRAWKFFEVTAEFLC